MRAPLIATTPSQEAMQNRPRSGLPGIPEQSEQEGRLSEMAAVGHLIWVLPESSVQ
jgi:hypothetical protein